MASNVPSPTGRPKRLVGTSLKMYFDYPSTLAYVRAAKEAYEASKQTAQVDIDFFVIPDFVSLTESRNILAKSDVLLGAQDCWTEDKGSYTGEVSPATLKQVGISIVEIGHAERRAMFGETDALVTKKAAAIIRNGMTPLVCIGEKNKGTMASEAVGIAVSECERQMKAALQGIHDNDSIIFAYEPVWAIGKLEKDRAQPDHIVAVTKRLRELTASRQGSTRIIYGGSASKGLFRDVKDGVDGLFLGRFAHNVEDLAQIIKEISEA